MKSFIYENGFIVKVSEDGKALRLFRGDGTPCVASMPYTKGPIEPLGRAMMYGFFGGWTACYTMIKSKADDILKSAEL